MKSATIYTRVNGQPYTVTPGPQGWTVTAASSPTDCFHRSYLVQPDAQGRPSRCTCPSHIHHGDKRPCKHVLALRDLQAAGKLAPIVKPAPAAEAKPAASAPAPIRSFHVLRDDESGWVTIYSVTGDDVVEIGLSPPGQYKAADGFAMPIHEARAHYGRRLAEGWRPLLSVNPKR